MKVLNFTKLSDDYHYQINVNRIRTNIPLGDSIVLKIDNQKSLFKVLDCDIKNKSLRLKKFQPCVYVWTTESYKLTNTYKVGIVNWQSVTNRLKQTDTTGVLERIELVEQFPLNIKNPKITLQIENEIHTRIGKVRKDREAVRGDYKKVIKPTIIKVINEFEAKPTSNITLPTPRYYQYDASKLAAKHFSKNDRGWIQWFCGTGKSYGGFWIWEETFKKIKVKNNIVIVLVPSKQLVIQTHNDWHTAATNSGYAIRSEMLASIKGSINSVDKISRWLDNSTPNTINLIVSTYQSSNKIAEALKVLGITADFLIGDEIHRLTGSQQKSWSKCLYNEYMPVRKRLSMTASPIEYEDKSLGMISMDNKKLFGKKIHTYGFLDAQFDGYIAPMEIVGIQLQSDKIEYIKKLVDKNIKVIQKNLYKDGIDITDLEKEVNVDEGSSIFFIQLHNTLMALKRGIIKHPIVYANSVKRMRMFMACLKVMSKSYGVTIDYLQTFTSEDEIQQRINDLNTKFSKSKIGVVGNVYCLQEGISINAVDGIIMIDPRSSGSAIIQILGRPSRLDNNNPNKIAKIILPIIFEEVNGKVILDKTNFDTTRDWMLSIVASDSDFENMIFNDLHCITTKSRNGVELKSVKVSNKKTSISGRNRNLDKDEIELEKIDFRDYVEFSKLKTFLSTKRTNEIQRKTKTGKNEYLTNHATTFLIDIEKKVSKALEEYNIKNFSRYVDLIHSKKELVSLFATQYNITNYTAEKILNSINIKRVLTKINKLDKLNYNNVLNLI